MYLFLRTCLGIVLPNELFGSSANKNRLLKAVQMFLNLGRYEKLYVGEIIYKVKVNESLSLSLKPSQETGISFVYT